MKMCTKCGMVPLKSNHERYCPTCREIAIKESKERANARKRAKRRHGSFRFNFKTPEEIEGPKPKVLSSLTSPASRRWAKMPWKELTLELMYYKMSYPESQLRAENNTLPKDFGLKRKKDEQCQK